MYCLRTLYVLITFTLCTVYVYCMFCLHILYVLFMYTLYSFYLHLIFLFFNDFYSVYVHFMYCYRTLYVLFTYTRCTVWTLFIFRETRWRLQAGCSWKNTKYPGVYRVQCKVFNILCTLYSTYIYNRFRIIPLHTGYKLSF